MSRRAAWRAIWRLVFRIAVLASRGNADVQHYKKSTHPADRSKEPHVARPPGSKAWSTIQSAGATMSIDLNQKNEMARKEVSALLSPGLIQPSQRIARMRAR